MKRIQITLLLSLAALLMLWSAGTGVWAQDASTAQPGTQFQPANPDAPPSGDAGAEARNPDADDAKPIGEGRAADADAADQSAESELQQAQAPDAPAPGTDGETTAEQAQTLDAPAPGTDGEVPAQAVPDAAAAAKPVPETESAAAPPEGMPWTDSELSKFYQPHPTSVRVAVLDTSGRARGAGLIAFLLEDYRKKQLETKIGKLVSVVNQSSVTGMKLENTVISYRPGNLRAALIMADFIPGKQYVAPMVPENTVKIAVDVEIRVGLELP